MSMKHIRWTGKSLKPEVGMTAGARALLGFLADPKNEPQDVSLAHVPELVARGYFEAHAPIYVVARKPKVHAPAAPKKDAAGDFVR